jgi:hypothetical protein
MTARARVCETFQTGVDPAGTEITILDGDVLADAAAPIRATLDLTTEGAGMWPTRAADLLAPYGKEIYVERGVAYGNGTVEYVGLGYYRIETPTQTAPPDGPIRLVGKDRMAGLIDARLISPVQFTTADTFGEVVTTLVTEVYPTATIEWDDTTDDDTLSRSLVADEDRWRFLDELVTSRGKIWYWDHRGVLVIKDPPSLTDPVADVSAGEGGVLIAMSRQLTRVGVYNAVVATGEGSDTATPARGVAYDANPLSPTYFSGRFGPMPRFFSSPLIETASTAQAAAVTLLRRSLGLPYVIDFTAVPNPALEPWDPVRVRSSVREAPYVHALEQVRIPLVASAPMTAASREQSTVLIGVA